MLNQSNQATLDIRLSLYLRNISDKDKQFKLNLIEYWLGDSDFSDIEPEQDIAYSFSTIFRVFEDENNPENRPKVFKEWFALLGLYFLNIDNNPYFSERRRLDFASFCLFLVENTVGGIETAEEIGARAYKKKRSDKGNEKRWEDLRPMIDLAVTEYPAVTRLILNAGKKLTYETIAEIIWPKIQHLNVGPDGKEIITPDEDPIGRVIAWLKKAREKKMIASPVELRRKK